MPLSEDEQRILDEIERSFYKHDPAFARNVKALREVQPEDVLPGDIDANLGAPWIPAGAARQSSRWVLPTATSLRASRIRSSPIWASTPPG